MIKKIIIAIAVGMSIAEISTSQRKTIMKEVDDAVNEGGNKTLILKHFKESEFKGYWGYMSKDLLLKLDEFREKLGSAVSISTAIGGIGRHDNSGSYHNIDKHGQVLAVDVMISSDVSLDYAAKIAKDVGFSGIGVYPHWRPSHGLHLDLRADSLSWRGFIAQSGKQEYDYSYGVA